MKNYNSPLWLLLIIGTEKDKEKRNEYEIRR